MPRRLTDMPVASCVPLATHFMLTIDRYSRAIAVSAVISLTIMSIMTQMAIIDCLLITYFISGTAYISSIISRFENRVISAREIERRDIFSSA